MHKFIAAEVTSLFVICCLGLVCCNMTNTTPPEPPVTVVGADASDASTAGSVANACAKITSLCTIDGGTCSAGFALMLKDPLQPLIDFTCIGSATSKAVLQGCAGVGVAGCP